MEASPNLAVVIQAGGEGRRLQKYTRNIPKSLLSVYGKTLLNHNLDILHTYFSNSDFYVISDHFQDVLIDYFDVYPHISNPVFIQPTGKGTASGLLDILKLKSHSQLLFLWCDLFLDELDVSRLSDMLNSDIIGLSKTFGCRWSINSERKLVESFSKTSGVAGLFYFNDTSQLLHNIPPSGEFVKWLSLQTNYNPKSFFFDNTLEVGDVKSYEDTFLRNLNRARFFNKITINDDLVEKECVDPAYASLLENEINWYQYVSKKGYQFSPGLYSINPLTIEKINGDHPDELQKPREEVIDSILASLKSLHQIETRSFDPHQIRSVYIEKTLSRINQVSKLLPLQASAISINGQYYQNPFHEENINQTINICEEILNSTNVDFCPIHGDPTFSNTIYSSEQHKSFFIDPRGIFGDSKIFGDPYYDFSKLIYSINGSYDSFNKRNFELIKYSSDQYWLAMPRSVFSDFGYKVYDCVESPLRIKLIHSLIWFSLCGYVRDHLDSIVGSYLKGILVFNECQKDFLAVSSLPKTWFLDVDGTIIEHNTQFSDENLKWLPNVEEFLINLSPQDTVVLTSARKIENLNHIINLVQKISPAKVTKVVSDLGVGERILINDQKPSGLITSHSVNLKRNCGLPKPFYMTDETM